MTVVESETYCWIGVFHDLDMAGQLAVAQLVIEGRAVVGTPDQIIDRLKRTRMLALLRERETDRIVGVAALKSPDQRYRTNKFNNAGVPIAGYETAPELGYVVVAKDMRGKQLSGKLVDAIALEIDEPTFATTGDHTMKNNLHRAGFIRVGRDWQGHNSALTLWVIASAEE